MNNNDQQPTNPSTPHQNTFRTPPALGLVPPTPNNNTPPPFNINNNSHTTAHTTGTHETNGARASPTTFLTLEQVNGLLREMTAVVTANINRHLPPTSNQFLYDDPYSNIKIESMASIGTTLKFNADHCGSPM